MIIDEKESIQVYYPGVIVVLSFLIYLRQVTPRS